MGAPGTNLIQQLSVEAPCSGKSASWLSSRAPGSVVLAAPHANAALAQVFDVGLAAIEVGLDHRPNGSVFGEQIANQRERGIRVFARLHIDAHRVGAGFQGTAMTACNHLHQQRRKQHRSAARM